MSRCAIAGFWVLVRLVSSYRGIPLRQQDAQLFMRLAARIDGEVRRLVESE